MVAAGADDGLVTSIANSRGKSPSKETRRKSPLTIVQSSSRISEFHSYAEWVTPDNYTQSEDVVLESLGLRRT